MDKFNPVLDAFFSTYSTQPKSITLDDAMIAHFNDLCLQYDLDVGECFELSTYIDGIEPELLLLKVNPISTPLLENAMFLTH